MSDLSSPISLPLRPNLRYLKDIAKAMVKNGQVKKLSIAQFRIAQQYGFNSWPNLKKHIESLQVGDKQSPTMQLLDACSTGNLLGIKKAIKAGGNIKHIYDLNLGYGSFNPPLKPALEKGHVDCIRYLLKQGALDRVWGWDSLRVAQSKDLNEIAEILSSHRNLEQQLADAIKTQSVDHVRELLADDPTLALANEAGHSDTLPPIVLATQLQVNDIVNLLLDAGADPAAEHHASSFNALTFAIYNHDQELIELFENLDVISDDITNYLFAALKGDQNRVKYYLDKGIDINAKDTCKQHVIPQAWRSGSKPLLDYLISNGADIHQSNGWEDYVWFAEYIEQGDVAGIKQILDWGYDPNHHDEHGHSPLGYAIQYKQPKIVSLLKTYGAIK